MTDEEKVVKPIKRESEEKPQEVEVTEEAEAEEEHLDIPEEPSVAPEDSYLVDPLFHKIADYFGIESYRKKELEKNKISVIVDWARTKHDAKDSSDIFSTIRRLEQTLRTPGMGERRINNVYRFVRLLAKRDGLDEELKIYKRVIEDDKG
jgi:hypothetical protein